MQRTHAILSDGTVEIVHPNDSSAGYMRASDLCRHMNAQWSANHSGSAVHYLQRFIRNGMREHDTLSINTRTYVSIRVAVEALACADRVIDVIALLRAADRQQLGLHSTDMSVQGAQPTPSPTFEDACTQTQSAIVPGIREPSSSTSPARGGRTRRTRRRSTFARTVRRRPRSVNDTVDEETERAAANDQSDEATDSDTNDSDDDSTPNHHFATLLSRIKKVPIISRPPYLGRRVLATGIVAHHLAGGTTLRAATQLAAEITGVAPGTATTWWYSYQSKPDQFEHSLRGAHPKVRWVLADPVSQQRAREWVRANSQRVGQPNIIFTAANWSSRIENWRAQHCAQLRLPPHPLPHHHHHHQ